MSAIKGNGSMSSLPLPQPKSPPELYGRRRELAKVQMLEREIGFLEEELKSIEGLQLASRSCKEVAEFVTGNPDPLIPTKPRRGSADHVASGNGYVEECRVSRFPGFAVVVARLHVSFHAVATAIRVVPAATATQYVPPAGRSISAVVARVRMANASRHCPNVAQFAVVAAAAHYQIVLLVVYLALPPHVVVVVHVILDVLS
ncbi:hypothetical protein OROGR_018538 [Orobanche gracilis]